MKNTKYNKNKIKKLFFGRSFGRLLCCSLGSSRSSSFKGDCPAVGQVQTPQMLFCPTGYSTTGLVVSAVEELNEKLTLLIDVLNRLPGGLVEGLGQALESLSKCPFWKGTRHLTSTKTLSIILFGAVRIKY